MQRELNHATVIPMPFAVIKTGGKQYRVSPGQKIRIEKLDADAGAEIRFDDVLLIADGEDVSIGMPRVSGATVTGKIVTQGRDKKKIVFKYHSKSRYHKKKGHRQPFTEVEITNIAA